MLVGLAFLTFVPTSSSLPCLQQQVHQAAEETEGVADCFWRPHLILWSHFSMGR
jgi:hypothetical protein